MSCLQDKLVKVAKKLKKNNVAVDVVAFGSEESNEDKLEAFVTAVNSGENSHLVTVPAGTILSDVLFGSPIFQIDGGAGYGAAAGAAGAEAGEGFEFGVDPNMDPELAMALRVSMQEERARQEAAAAAAAQAAGGAAGLPTVSPFFCSCSRLFSTYLLGGSLVLVDYPSDFTLKISQNAEHCQKV